MPMSKILMTDLVEREKGCKRKDTKIKAEKGKAPSRNRPNFIHLKGEKAPKIKNLLSEPEGL